MSTFLAIGQNVTVNPGAGSYATLKAAFDAINAGTHTGSITIDIVNNTTETAPAVLNASGTGSASYTSILIQPSGGAARTVSGAIAAGSPLVDLNGADNVTFDGLNSGGNSLIFANTTVSTTSNTSTIRLIGGATSNTITRCSVQGSFSASVATNGGNIFISTDAVTGMGNDNNTISFCDIGPVGTNLPTKGIYANGTSTTTTHYNSGNIISDNNIFDFFGPAVASAGIYMGGGNIDYTISGNKLFQTATRTQTTGTVHAGIQLASANINNCTISGNTIGFSSAGGTGTYTFAGIASSRFYPIYLSSHGTTTATTIANNIVKNIAMSGLISGTSSTAPFIGIFISSGLANATDNTIGEQGSMGNISFNSSATTTGEVYGIYNFSSSTTIISSNMIGSFSLANSATGSCVFFGIRSNTSSTAGITCTITDNIIGGSVAGSVTNTSTASSSRIIGILHELSTPTITGNLIRNMTMLAGNTGTTTAASVIGISQTATANSGYTISNNIIHSLSNTNASAAVSVFGIRYTGSTTGTNVVTNNIIHSLNNGSTSATADLRGIIIAGGTATISNNMVRLGITESGSSVTGGIIVYGIYDNNTVATGNNYYYNTVYVGGSGVAGTANSWAFRSDGSTNTRVFKNNIFNNARSNGAGTGKHYAIQLAGVGVNPTGLTSNRNNLRADGAGGVLGLYDGVDRANLGAWSAGTGQDVNSIEETPDFLNATGDANSVDLRIDVTTSTNMESGAENIAGITSDFEGDIRQGNPGYGGSGTAPDIGADEFNGMTPTCSGAPAASNAVVSPSPPLCPGASFTLTLDQSYTAVEYQWQSSPDNMVWTDIPGATFESHVTSSLSTLYFRAVITCPASMLSTNSGSVLVTVLAQLNGGYTIDNTLPTAGANYNTFTEAIADLNCRGVSGPVTYSVTAGQTFVSPDSLNITATGTSSNTITFVKLGAGPNPKIQRSGTGAANNYILRIGGGDYFTFDGIDFEQTGTMASDFVEYGVYLQNASALNGASNNTIKNGVISMAQGNSASKGVYVHASPTPTSSAGTNSHNLFLNLTIQNSYEGYRIDGATNTFPDTNNIIDSDGVGISMIQTLGDGTATGSMYGVFGSYQKGFAVRNTEIMDLSPGGTSLVYGITLQSSTANTAEIFNNHIHDIAGGGTVYGIYMSSGDTITVERNRVHTLSTTGTSSALKGIYLTATGLGALVSSNRIYGLSSTGITTTTVSGIDIGAGTGYYLVNNMISGLTASASTNTTGGTRGIWVSSGSTGSFAALYYNTILLSDVAAVSGYTSAGISNSSTTPTLDLRNNLVVNNSDISTIGLRVAAFWKTAATDNVSTACNNNLYYAGTPSDSNLIYFDPSNMAQTMAAYTSIASIVPAETFSVTENVDFDPVVDGAIRPDVLTVSLVESGAAEIPAFGIDFESDNRGTYPLGGQVNGGGFSPDIGADEGDFTYLLPPVPDCPTLDDPMNGELDICSFQTVTLSWTPAITGGLPSLGYDVYFGTSMTPPLLANTSLTSYAPAGLAPNTTYYWQIVPKNATGPAVGCVVYSFTTLDIAVTSTAPASRCGTGTVTLGATGVGTLNWYDTPVGGSAIGMGSSFVTPVINSTTDFYVAASDGFITTYGARPNPAGTSTTTASTYGLVFDATQSFLLESVEVYASAAGNVVVHLTNSSGTLLQSATVPVSGLGTGTPEALVLNFNIPAGTGHRLLAISSPAMVRESSLGGFPYSLGANGNVTNGYITGNSTTYYYFYNWKMQVGCETPRTAVTATITPADPILLSPASITRCDAEPPSPIMASSTYAYAYTWSPASGLDMTSGPNVLADPSSTTTYTVTGDDGLCFNTATVEVTVNTTPATPVVDPISICQGDTGTLMVTNPISDPPTTGSKIGSGTSTTSIPGPYRRFYGGHRYQMLYTAAEISASGITAGEIISLSFYVNTVPGGVTVLDNVEIKLKNTSSTSLSTTFETGGTSVYTALSYQPVVGLNTHTFNGTSFIWDGTSNLLVDFCFNNAGTGGASTSTEYTTVAGSCTSFPLDNSATVCTNASGTVSDLRPNIRLQKAGLGIASYGWNPGNLTGVSVEVFPSSSTVYTVTGTFPNGCADSSTVLVTVTSAPTILLGPNPSVCSGITMADLTYSGTTNSPDEYSIDFDAGAEAQGFADETNVALPVSPIVITVPGAAIPGTYNAIVTVRNSISTCASQTYPITVTVLTAPNAGTVSGTSTLCVAATSTFTSNGDPGGMWSSTNPLVASVNAMTGLVTALAPGTTDITYTVSNACGGPVADFETLTVDPVEVENTNDSGAGSLRDIIACAGNGATITFDASLMAQIITLTSGEIIIDKDLTLAGIGMANLTISGNSASRIFQVQPGKTLRIEDMALKNATAVTNGGALYVLGSLILENVLLENNDENGVPKGLTIINPAQLEIIGTVDIKE